MKIEQRLQQLGLVLSEPLKVPAGVEVPFAWVRVYADRAYVSGHGPLNHDGSPAGPFVHQNVRQSDRKIRLDRSRGSRLLMDHPGSLHAPVSMPGRVNSSVGRPIRSHHGVASDGSVQTRP